jgi:hypothetical protein
MVIKHYSIQLLWNKHDGLEDCKGKPAVGGIAAIERHQNLKWQTTSWLWKSSTS